MDSMIRLLEKGVGGGGWWMVIAKIKDRLEQINCFVCISGDC